jgi:hypothetical protein
MVATDSSTAKPGPQPEPLDGIELTEDDLDVVVGGLSPEASMAYVAYLRESAGRQSHAARLDWLRSSAVLWRDR